jgi:hypothetical protein
VVTPKGAEAKPAYRVVPTRYNFGAYDTPPADPFSYLSSALLCAFCGGLFPAFSATAEGAEKRGGRRPIKRISARFGNRG